MPYPIIGNVPRGEDYFGQEQLIENLWGILEKDNILLTAPRRFGKTAAMYRLLDEPRPQFLPVYTDIEPIATAGDFMVELISKIYQKRYFRRIINKLWEGSKDIATFFRNLPEDIDIGGFKFKVREATDMPVHWKTYGERLMDLISVEDPSLLLILDEFAVMIDNIARKDPEEAENVLRWFRAARIAPETRTRFVIGSSINLIPTLDTMGLVDTVNDLYIQKLQPFDDDTAKRYINEIFDSQRVSLSTEARDVILELVGTPIPYLLAVFLSIIIDQHHATEAPVSPDLIKTVFNEDLLGGRTAASFRHYRSRIDTYYPGWEGDTTRAILKSLSRTADGMEKQTLYQLFLKYSARTHSHKAEEGFMNLMYKLENDFYISEQKGRYDFFSRILKLWWKSNYGFQGG